MMNKALKGLNAYISGHLAEKKACSFLEENGYTFVAKNVRSFNGIGANEIDLIMKKDKTLIFIEVKKRAKIDESAYAITPLIQKRIYRAAEIFLAHHAEFADYFCRFDAILINDKNEVTHIENAWQK